MAIYKKPFIFIKSITSHLLITFEKSFVYETDTCCCFNINKIVAFSGSNKCKLVF